MKSQASEPPSQIWGNCLMLCFHQWPARWASVFRLKMCIINTSTPPKLLNGWRLPHEVNQTECSRGVEWVRNRANPAGNLSGTWTLDHWMSTSAPKPQGHVASATILLSSTVSRRGNWHKNDESLLLSKCDWLRLPWDDVLNYFLENFFSFIWRI